MNKLSKNIILTLIGGGIITFGIMYRKKDTNIGNIGIIAGILILLIGYLMINSSSENKYVKVIKEYNEGDLYTSKGKKVTNITQAKAIAMSTKK